MTSRLAVLLLGAFVAAGVGCDRKPAKQQETLAQPYFWSLEKDGRQSYVLGTMHMGIDASRLPHDVWQTLERMPLVALEADLSDFGSLPVKRTDGTTLRDELGPEYWKKLEDAVGREVSSYLPPLKPSIAVMELSRIGLDQTPGIDDGVRARAIELGKRFVYFETLAFQFNLFEKWFDTRELKSMLDHLAPIKATTIAMRTAYVTGDVTAMLAVQDKERAEWLARGRTEADYAELMEDFLYRRNASWIPAIEKLHAEGGAFIAVGALHLVGSRSVVDLLEKQGFKVRRVVSTVRAP